MVVDRLPGLLRDLEANRPSCFALSNGGSINGITIGRYVNDLEADNVAATKFAVDGQVKQRDIPEVFQ